MEFMLLFVEDKRSPGGGPEGFAEMKKFAVELASQRKLRRGAPLRPESEAARVRVQRGVPVVTDGPFAESKEVLGGFCIVDVASREDAIEIARRCPHARYGIVEVHTVEFRNASDDPGDGAPFLFTFCAQPRIVDADRSKLREMLAFSDTLTRQGKLFETGPLGDQPLRVESRNGKIVVTDGPFPETKEVVGGYALLRAKDRAEAIEIAKRYPHSKWGPLELREIRFFDPV